ncbi:zinc finger MYND domain-containing protein 15-like [Lineus longissimus]|uniref:zinc finger MYND domain-containing protein 15-like n=1 Tax=Lineus longissimus TaxID=88925 RepID=UPI002B4CB955
MEVDEVGSNSPTDTQVDPEVIRIVSELPMEDTYWVMTQSYETLSSHGNNERLMEILDRYGNVIGRNFEDDTCPLDQQALDLICQACLQPFQGKSRKPRYLTYRHCYIPIPLSELGILNLGGEAASACPADEPVMRQCCICRMRGTEGLFFRCQGCDVVYYCSRICQEADLKQPYEMHSHRAWCAKMKEFAAKTDEMADLPFAYAAETTTQDFTVFRYREFLHKSGVLGQGLWRHEIPHHHGMPDGYPLEFGGLPEVQDPWILPVEGSILDSEKPEAKLASPLQDWKSYYEWRGLRLDSPVAIILSFPLTLYYVGTTLLIQDFPNIKPVAQNPNQCIIHVIGVEKEVDLIPAFFELGILMPDTSIEIHMVGVELSKKCDGRERTKDNVKITVHRCTYQKFFKQGNDKPDLAIGFNAGVGAYMTWAEALELLKDNNIPSYFTDYCQYSCECANGPIKGLNLGEATKPIVNPFRSPIRKFCEEQTMPWYSNGFIYRLNY